MQTSVYLDTRRLLDRAVRWLVTNRRSPIDVPAEIARLRDGVTRLLPGLEDLFYGDERQGIAAHMDSMTERGLPRELAERATRLMYSFGLIDVVETANASGRDVGEVASVYFVLSDLFRVDSLLSKISLLPREDRWQTLARMALRYDLYAALAALTAEVLDSTPGDLPPHERVQQWEQSNATSIHRARAGDGGVRRVAGGPRRPVGAAAPDPHPGADLRGRLSQVRRTRSGRSGDPDRPDRVSFVVPAHAARLAKTTMLSG